MTPVTMQATVGTISHGIFRHLPFPGFRARGRMPLLLEVQARTRNHADRASLAYATCAAASVGPRVCYIRGHRQDARGLRRGNRGMEP